MSIQNPQVALIDLNGKPEGATHYGIMSRGETMWYSLVGTMWWCWSVQGEWIEVLNNKPGLNVLPIPAQPDWSKGPGNATHFGPSCGSYHEAFFQIVDGGWLMAHWENDWFWREYRNMGNDRIAMLIERPKGIDWSAAPDWALGHGLLSDDQTPAWIGKAQYLYVGSRATPYQFSSDHDHPLFFHWTDVKGYVERPQAFDWSGAPEDATHRHIEDQNSPFRKLVGASDAYAWVRGEWIFIAPSCDGRKLYEPRPFVPLDFSGPVLDFSKADDVPEWDENGLPPVGTFCERSFSHSTWKATAICGHSTDGAYAAFYDGDGLMGWADKCKLRPIRTPEQIAADERLHKIRNAGTDIANTLTRLGVAHASEHISVIEAMIDAGYAKPSVQVVEIGRKEALERMHKLYIEGASEHKGGLASLYDGGMRFVEVAK